jgi:hypothetical protein
MGDVPGLDQRYAAETIDKPIHSKHPQTNGDPPHFAWIFSIISLNRTLGLTHYGNRLPGFGHAQTWLAAGSTLGVECACAGRRNFAILCALRRNAKKCRVKAAVKVLWWRLSTSVE